MTPNGVQKDGTVSEQWRLQWGYPLFRVDRGWLIGHVFSYITGKKHRTAKIMAPQLFMGNLMALILLSVDALEGFKSRSRQLKAALATEPLHVFYWYLLAKVFGMSNTIKRQYDI